MSNEINRILKLLTDLQHGDCWLGTNYKEAMHGVDHVMATKHISGHTNNIWQLIAHVTYWRSRVVNRLTGSDNPPPFQDFLLPVELNEVNWRQTLHDFESAYHLLRNAIHYFKEDHLEKPSPKEGQTFYQLIMGSLLHDSYHLGQIVLLKRAFN